MVTKKEIREYFAKFGKEGGKKRAKNMTAEQRAEAARKASQARWAKLDRSMEELKQNLAELEGKTKPRATKPRKSGSPSAP